MLTGYRRPGATTREPVATIILDMHAEDAAGRKGIDVKHVRTLAREFLQDAWDVLEPMHIVPRPHHQPHMSVGEDWFGPDIEHLASRTRLETALADAFPNRFSEDLPMGKREYPISCSYRMFEWAVANETQTPRTDAFEQAIDDTLLFLSTTPNVMIVERIVSHVDLVEEAELGSTSVRVSRIDPDGWIAPSSVLETAGLQGAELFLYSKHPHAILASRVDYRAGGRWDELLDSARDRVDTALTLLRLFRRTSARNVAEYAGFIDRGAFVQPYARHWPGDMLSSSGLDDSEASMRLSPEDISLFSDFERLYADAISAAVEDWRRRDLGVAGLQTGLRAFYESFGVESWQAQVPRLITALEGWFLPESATEGVAHRLRTRMCLLLQDGAASSARLYDDIQSLYDLRSQIEHASDVKVAKVNKRMRDAAESSDDMHGINQRRAVEKLRELARKAICARLILATGDDPLWPITDTASIDRRLLDDTFRDRCRESLHHASKTLGMGIFRAPEWE